jgi:hypothetical protein
MFGGGGFVVSAGAVQGAWVLVLGTPGAGCDLLRAWKRQESDN